MLQCDEWQIIGMTGIAENFELHIDFINESIIHRNIVICILTSLMSQSFIEI
jgi:hypothetical protein